MQHDRQRSGKRPPRTADIAGKRSAGDSWPVNLLDCLPTEGDRYLALLSDIADSLRTIARRERAESPQEQAIRLLATLGPDNVTAIADAVGVHKATLYRCKPFREALDRSRDAKHWTPREREVGDISDVGQSHMRRPSDG